MCKGKQTVYQQSFSDCRAAKPRRDKSIEIGGEQCWAQNNASLTHSTRDNFVEFVAKPANERRPPRSNNDSLSDEPWRIIIAVLQLKSDLQTGRDSWSISFFCQIFTYMYIHNSRKIILPALMTFHQGTSANGMPFT